MTNHCRVQRCSTCFVKIVLLLSFVIQDATSSASRDKLRAQQQQQNKMHYNISSFKQQETILLEGPAQRPAAKYWQVEEVSSDRRVLDEADLSSGTNSSSMEIQLWYSVWFPMFNNAENDEVQFDELVDIQTNAENEVRNLVLESFVTLLCQQTDIRFVESEQGIDSAADICSELVTSSEQDDDSGTNDVKDDRVLWIHRRSRRFLEATTEFEASYARPILWNNPKVQIRRRSQTMLTNVTTALSSGDTDATYAYNSSSALDDEQADNSSPLQKNTTLTWTVWTVTYPVLRMGDLYVQETLLNQPDLSSDELQTASLETMKEVIQLAVDVNLVDQKLDSIFSDYANSWGMRYVHAHASPIRMEWSTFYVLLLSSYTVEPFVPRLWYPMRIAGILIFILTFVIYLLLTTLGNRRRKRIVAQEQERKLLAANSKDSDEAKDDTYDRWLTSNIAVEQMLDQSSEFTQNQHSIQNTSRGKTHPLPSFGDSEIASNPNALSRKQRPSSNDTTILPSSQKHAVGQVIPDILKDDSNRSNKQQASFLSIKKKRNDMPKGPGNAAIGRNPTTGDAYFSNSSFESNHSGEGEDEHYALQELLRQSQYPSNNHQ